MYIQKIEIKNFWGNDLAWTLNEDVNVLIGENGSGKSKILRMLNEAISPTEDSQLNFRLFDPIDEIIIALQNNIVIRVSSEGRSITGCQELSNQWLNAQFINTFDVLEKNLNPNNTLLDQQIDNLKQRFVTYQRDLSNQVEEALKTDDKELRRTKLQEIEDIYDPKNIFIRILDDLFSRTGKRFDEKEFLFIKEGIQTPIFPQDLSSGEKQVFIILLTALLQDRKPCILLMDEPEISLHINWQRSLIRNIRQINPNCQIIMVTHSPTVYYQGWSEKITRIEDIKSAANSITESTILAEETAQSGNYVLEIKQDFDGFSGNSLTRLYHFNRHLNTYTSFTKDECIELLDFLQERGIYPDVITFTTLISKLNNFADAREIFDLIKAEQYSKWSHVKPNNITLNTLIKKVSRVQEGIQLIQEITSSEESPLYPDIITFSTLLGKAKDAPEIELIEEMRNYYGVEANPIYLNKLRFKK